MPNNPARNATKATPAKAAKATPTKAAKATPAKAAAAKTASPTPAATAVPVATILPRANAGTMIVCVPDDLHQVLTSTRQLERHFGVSGTSCPRYWASPALRLWQRRQLIDLRAKTAGPRHCAGGPIRLLDLDGMRHGAYVGASLRHAQWSGVVAGTPHATPWPVFLQKHLNDPSGYPMDTATHEFHRQPRVKAMRMHNAATYGPRFDVGDLEIFQSGPSAYASYHALWAVCTDAFLTADGRRLESASAHFADRITYLERTRRYLESLDGSQRLLAVTLHQN
ncbi:hypothetical protein [Micromonospora sp. WMMD1082]|uniref:hypothetical protein n=1 Tax=Micromonospora sp. WMMD1082 TaxID=3016104 RepID=UPI002415DC82|nr:hypothetical protein [Micromonospora sp. WMMD1082]MDG4795057.1 hypothetical protein [Micromonospora sp. WMMD1082]